MNRRQSACMIPLVAAAFASVGCGHVPSPKAAASATGEWASGPADLRRMTALVRVAPPARLKASFEQIAARSEDADFGGFLRAHAAGGFGSGFVMVHRMNGGDRAFVVTNRHVVAESTDAEVSFSDGTTYRNCEIVLVSQKYDLAVLALPESATKNVGHGLVPRDAATSERLSVVASGYPGVGGAPSYQVTDGKISNAQFSLPERGLEESFIQHTAAIDPGSSGGPLTDEAGRLVGVNVMMIRNRASMFFAVPAGAVTETVRIAHELASQRQSQTWMKGELEHACQSLSAELASASGSTKRVMSFMSNELVADEGLASYLFVTQTKAAPSLRRVFFEDPVVALRASVMVRLAMRAELGGGVRGCAAVNPSDERNLAKEKTVRLALTTPKGDLELRWTFEQGTWRVVGGDLLDVRAILAAQARAEAENTSAKVAAKSAKRVGGK